jgi:hypothetical protein
MKRLLAALVALVLPPVGVYLWGGRGLFLGLAAGAWVTGLLVFFLWMAGPGFLLVLAATLFAVAGILFSRPSGRAA